MSVTALKHEQWERSLKYLLRFVRREGHAAVPKSHVEKDLRLGEWVQSQRGRRFKMPVERLKKLENLPGWIWSVNDARWGKAYSHLLRFVEREGHAHVPKGHIEDGFRLGQWVIVRRHRRHQLPEEREKALENLPGWVWDASRFPSWEEGYEHLLDFVKREGHSRVPEEHVEDGFDLGTWVSNQRTLKSKLTDDKIVTLEKLPEWIWKIWETERWEDGRERLLKYVEREGHARVPRDHAEDSFRLGTWVANRRRYRGRLSEEQDRFLCELPGWLWDAGPDRAWEIGFEHLRRFVKRNGHVRVPSSHEESGFTLGRWVVDQRRKRTSLSDEQKNDLEELPGWVWNIREEQWREGYECLLRFVERDGHARVPASHIEDGYNLGQWVIARRFDRVSLAPKRVDALESLPFWTWSARQHEETDYEDEKWRDRWRKYFHRLYRFALREGHTKVPLRHVEEGFRIGGWVRYQRSQRERMPEIFARELAKLPGWRWSMKQRPRTETDDKTGMVQKNWPRGMWEKPWKKRYELLLGYCEREGHARVPQSHKEDGFGLGSWVSIQRRRRKILSDEQQASLGRLPGWVWEINADRWEKSYEHLVAFVEREGHTVVPHQHVEDGFRLGGWLHLQRRRRLALPMNRAAALEKLPGWIWDPRMAKWNEYYEHFVRFVEREGHARIQKGLVEGDLRLGEWVYRQRSDWEKLSEKQVRQLEKIIGVRSI